MNYPEHFSDSNTLDKNIVSNSSFTINDELSTDSSVDLDSSIDKTFNCNLPLSQRSRQLRPLRPPVFKNSDAIFPYIIVFNYLLSQSGCPPNAFSAKIQIPSKLNIDT